MRYNQMTKIKYDKETYDSEVAPTESGYYFTIYQITNLINGKIYIGKNKTKNLLNDYLGSGKLLHLAYKKYGLENFEKKYLYFLTSENEMNNKEAEIVNEDFVARNDTYNMKLGGDGSWSYINEQRKSWTDEEKKQYAEKISNKVSKYTQSEERRELSRQIRITYNKSLKGKKRPEVSHNITPETRKKLSNHTYQQMKEHPICWIRNIKTGELKCQQKEKDIPEGFITVIEYNKIMYEQKRNNYCGLSKETSKRSHNSRWITNGKEDKFLLFDKIDEYLKNGWRFGRSKGCSFKISNKIPK